MPIKLLAPEKGDKVLDLGCGTGYLSKVLADLVGPEGQVVAIDPDTERLKVAKDKYTASNLQYLEGLVITSQGESMILFSQTMYCIGLKIKVFSSQILHRV